MGGYHWYELDMLLYILLTFPGLDPPQSGCIFSFTLHTPGVFDLQSSLVVHICHSTNSIVKMCSVDQALYPVVKINVTFISDNFLLYKKTLHKLCNGGG